MLVLDAGAFVAVERGDRDVVALVKRERLSGRAPVTNGGVVGQVWRGGSGRQAPVARLLAGVDVAPIDDLLEQCFRATSPQAHMDGAYEKVLARAHGARLPLRLLPPFEGASEDSCRQFLSGLRRLPGLQR